MTGLEARGDVTAGPRLIIDGLAEVGCEGGADGAASVAVSTTKTDGTCDTTLADRLRCARPPVPPRAYEYDAERGVGGSLVSIGRGEGSGRAEVGGE